jgi:ATP phosphoribosyltransferase regulatory subunit HisZ
VGLEAAASNLDLGEAERALLTAIPRMRGGADVLERARDLGGDVTRRAVSGLAETYDGLAERGIADRVSLDLGLLRDLGYYTGAILEVYDPALGHILGGGGRYDDLLGRFGRELPAAGFSLYLERVHLAQMEEERLSEEGNG